MKKNKKQKTLQETLSQIDGVLAALDSYPNLEDALLEKAQNKAAEYLGKIFPTQLDFSKELLEHLVGTDVMIDIVSKFLTYTLPAVEVSLKSALLANMQNLGTNCEIDPYIRERAIKEGIMFDLKQIDLIDKLTISPLDEKIGQYYYFGTEGCESAYDVLQSAIDPNNQSPSRQEKIRKKNTDNFNNNPDNKGKTISEEEKNKGIKEGTSYLNRAMNDSVGHYFGGRKRDFDCLLWYMKNKAAYREVWGKRTSESEDIFYGDKDVAGWLKKKGDTKTRYYQINGNNIIFWEYNEGSKWVKNGNGGMVPMSGTSYPFLSGSKLYEYKYGNAPIKKLSRKKYYYSSEHGIFYCNDKGDWNLIQNSDILPKESTDKGGYGAMEDLPADEKIIHEGVAVKVDGSVFVITGKPTFHENKGGKLYISSVKNKECIDITNDLKNDTCIFVDYDEKDGDGTVGDSIKNGKTPESTFKRFGINNDGQKQWYKNVIKDIETEDEPQNSNNAYYIKKSTGTKYESVVDKVLIPPYTVEKIGENKYKAKHNVCLNDALEKDNKYTKDFGVVTLDFSPRTGNILQSDGDPMQQQTPYDNVLHVFFGNVKELHTSERDRLQETWKNSADYNKMANTLYKILRLLQENNEKLWIRRQKDWKKRGVEPLGDAIFFKDENGNRFQRQEGILFAVINAEYNLFLNGDTISNVEGTTYRFEKYLTSESELYEDTGKLATKITSLNKIVTDYYNEIKDLDSLDYVKFKEFRTKLMNELSFNNGESYWTINALRNRMREMMDANENLVYLSAKNLKYPEAKKNYYFKHTLFEFNVDYVNSLQLFDPKVLAAQIITSLFGGATISAMVGATASWKTELIHDVVKDMVEKVIAAEDFAVSDCFFTFTNDAYNGMLRAAELREAGLYSQHGEANGNNTIDPVKLLEGLNGIDSAADQEGQTTIIKGALTTAAAEVSKDIYKEDSYLAINTNFGVKMSFVETLMINLCTQLVMAMLSPKVYLLILINLEMFGMSTNFTLKSFIENFQNLIRSIVEAAVKQFMMYLSEEIMKIVEELVQKLVVKLQFEQVEMYARLLKQILAHLRALTKCGAGPGWTQDVIGYADIISSDIQEPIDEC